jgi:hypothetical protein
MNKSKTEIVLVSFFDYNIVMLNWLKKKVQEKSDQESKNGFKRVEKFLKFAQSKSDIF